MKCALQRHNTENSKQIFSETELRGHSPSFHIHVAMSDLYIPTIDLPILLHEYMYVDRSWEYPSHTVKKGLQVSRPQPGCNYQTLLGRE